MQMKPEKIREKLERIAEHVISDIDAHTLILTLAEHFPKPKLKTIVPAKSREMRSVVSIELEDNLKLMLESSITNMLIRRCGPLEVEEIALIDNATPARVLSLNGQDGDLSVTISMPSWLGLLKPLSFIG